LEIDTPITTTAPSAAWVSGWTTLVLAALASFSASTSAAGLSSRKPLKEAWRIMPAPVQPASSISATRAGRAQCMLPSFSELVPAAKGLTLLSNCFSRGMTSRTVPASKPVPTRPTYTSFLP
jgi:hypothetical protein